MDPFEAALSRVKPDTPTTDRAIVIEWKSRWRNRAEGMRKRIYSVRFYLYPISIRSHESITSRGMTIG